MAAKKHTTFVQLDLPMVDTTEEWRSVVGWEERYEVSNLGHVRSLHFKRGIRVKNLRPTRYNKKYLSVTLYGRGKRYVRPIHALVLEAFIGPRPYKGVGNHLNGIGADNRACNLEWTSYQGNSRHAFATGLMENARRPGETNGYARFRTHEVLEMRRLYDAGTPLRSLLKQFGGSTTTVWGIVKRRTWKHLPEENSSQGWQENHTHGASHHNARFSEEDVIRMRTMATDGLSISAISKVFAASSHTIRRIVRGQQWKHLLEE